MTRATIVGRQLDFYHEQSEAWKRDSVDAEECKDFEEIIAFGAYVFERIKHIDTEWTAEMLAMGREPDAADAEAVWNLYRNWTTRTAPNLELAKKIAAKRYHVEGLDRYWQYYREAMEVVSLPVDRLRQSRASLDAGRVRPLGEVRDEIQRRLNQ